MARGAVSSRGPGLLALYRGHFAPEFEYEEWASEYRTHLHATYLRLAWMVSNAFVSERRFGEAVEVLTPVATVDPAAFELRAVLIGCLANAGARDAAIAHYRSLALAQERELGVTPPPFEDLVRAVSL
jgi:DNA-binding SARP family transcriptional activator